jgi:HrpA-like RNA helicase
MDRRYNISPPGETTKYKITKSWDTNDNTVDKAIQLSKEKVIELCKTNSSGNILLFSLGKKEILEMVYYLNLNTPYYCIAIPFYGEMDEKYKDIISNIKNKLSNIKTKKENVHIEWSMKYKEDSSVSNNIYKRAIIVATNVAEASLTIDKLYDVIDIGYEKVLIYNNK